MTVNEAIAVLSDWAEWLNDRKEIYRTVEMSDETAGDIVKPIQQQQAQLQNIAALLADDYSESKDWQAGDVVERVRWLQVMFNAKKDEVEQQQQQIEQLKCCGNCKHYQQEKELHRTDILYCDIDLSTTNKPWAVCNKWEGVDRLQAGGNGDV